MAKGALVTAAAVVVAMAMAPAGRVAVDAVPWTHMKGRTSGPPLRGTNYTSRYSNTVRTYNFVPDKEPDAALAPSNASGVAPSGHMGSTVNATSEDNGKAAANETAPPANELANDTSTALAADTKDGEPPPAHTIKVSLPLIVVGMPKSGTASLHRYFRCSGLSSAYSGVGASTWLEEVRNGTDQALAELVFSVYGEKNGRGHAGMATHACARAGRPLFDCIPPHQAYAGFDLPTPPDCFLPQSSHLERLMLDYPTATFVLNRRPAEHWVESARNWRGGMLTRLRMCTQDAPAFDSAHNAAVSRADARGAWRLERNELQAALVDYMDAHADRVRELAARYGRPLIEVDIEGEDTGPALEAAIGGHAKCWGKYGAFEDMQTAKEAAKEESQLDSRSIVPAVTLAANASKAEIIAACTAAANGGGGD